MKRTALALVVPALLAMGTAHAAEVYNKDGNKLDLYGKVDGLHYFSDDAGSNGDKSYARLGFKGETQINSELSGYGQWEYNLRANSNDGGNNAWTRLAFAGLKFSEYGSFDYGRNYGVLYDVEGYTDMLPEFGGDTSAQTDVFMTGRTTGVATYRNTDFFGLVDGWNFALQYQGKNESASGMQEGASGSHDKKAHQNGDGWGISTSYDTEMGVNASAAYTSSDRSNEQQYNSTATGDRADAWATGLKYDANNVYLATMYSETLNMTAFGSDYIANKTQNFEVVAQYQFDFGLRPSIAYLQSKGKDLHTAYGNNQDLVKYIDIGATYYFNKNMSTYVDYKINLLDEDKAFYQAAGISTDDIVAVGLVYQF